MPVMVGYLKQMVISVVSHQAHISAVSILRVFGVCPVRTPLDICHYFIRRIRTVRIEFLHSPLLETHKRIISSKRYLLRE